MKFVFDPMELTPCQCVDGLWLKRDDLFAPFGVGDVNGGKLRQCMLLVNTAFSQKRYNGVISCCSIHSPQAPITASVAEAMGIPCEIWYGATTADRLKTLPMPRLAFMHGANLRIASKSGRHTILYSKARKWAEKNGFFVVEYGFNLENYESVLLNAVSRQVENIPDELDRLIITCGSGISTSGILRGLDIYGKDVKEVHIVNTAPSRDDLIYRLTGRRDLYKHDLFHRERFKYEDKVNASYHGIRFHPHYEAKTFSWLMAESGVDIHDGKTCMWIVGSEPTKGMKQNIER